MMRASFGSGIVLACIGAAACGDDTAASTTGEGGASSSTVAATATSTSAAATTTGSSGSTGGSGSGGEAAALCGDAPWVTVGGTLLAYPTSEPVEGATISSDSCPGVTTTTDEQGYGALQATAGAPYYPKVVADGFITMRTGEQVPLVDFEGGVPLYPAALTSLLPHWSEQSPTILVVVFSDPIQGAECDDLNGYTFAVTDHPEAIVTYYSGTDTPTPDESLTSTGPLGIAEIAGLDATAGGPLIGLTAEKPGCEVSFDSYPHTGNFVLEDGVLTLAGAFSPPVSPPD